MEELNDEARNLRRCIRELVALSMLSATWGASEPPAIAESLADVLLRALPLDLVYVRLSAGADGSVFETASTRQGREPACRVREIGEALAPLLASGVGHPARSVPHPAGEGELCIAVVPLGYEGDCGVLAAGSRQPDFPGQTDSLLLGVAANQAASVLQRRRAEEARQAERQRAERSRLEADRRKDEFLATLAHELRNPLAPICNTLEIMRRLDGDALAQARAHRTMERQVQQMVRLVDDLLDLSRISRDTLELRRERIDLAAAIESAVETSEPLIAARGHTLDVVLPAEPMPLDADLTRLAQVLANLLNNAAKYSPRGGSIGLTAEPAGGEVVVRVRDTGIGIRPDMLPQIFEMFVQADRSLERSQGGLGIGLTLARRLVEMHGGTLEAHSDGPGQGSEFVVRLPLAEAREARAAAAGGEAAAPVRRRILVVDDNEDSADSLSLLLGILGNEVRTAYDGLSAVETAQAFQPAVVLLDLGLPKLNGYDAARRIRAEAPDVMLIALTGWGQDEDRRRSREAGFDHHLVKPIELATLRELLAADPS